MGVDAALPMRHLQGLSSGMVGSDLVVLMRFHLSQVNKMRDFAVHSPSCFRNSAVFFFQESLRPGRSCVLPDSCYVLQAISEPLRSGPRLRTLPLTLP